MAYTKEQRLINSISGSTKQQRSEPRKNNESFQMANNSGDHQRSIKRNDPVNDYDLVNKSYVDDEIDLKIEDGTSVGQIAFWDGTKWVHTETSEFYWDDTNKRLGIGTSSPARPLHIESASSLSGNLQLETSDSIANGLYSGITFTSTGVSGRRRAGILAESTGANAGWGADLIFLTRYAPDGSDLQSTDERMRITNTGNVGIGTSSPSTLFEVNATDGRNSLTWMAKLFNEEVTAGQSNGLLIQAGNDADDSVFSINNRTGTRMLEVEGGGNVGIGTSSPATFLNINDASTDGTSTATFPLGITGDIDNDGGYVGIRFGYNGNLNQYQKAGIIVEGTSGSVQPNMHFALESTAGAGNVDISDAKMTILNSGKVGIGTTTPNEILTAEGAVSIKEQAAAPSNTAAYGKLWVKNTTPCELWFTDDAGTSTQIV